MPSSFQCNRWIHGACRGSNVSSGDIGGPRGIRTEKFTGRHERRDPRASLGSVFWSFRAANRDQARWPHPVRKPLYTLRNGALEKIRTPALATRRHDSVEWLAKRSYQGTTALPVAGITARLCRAVRLLAQGLYSFDNLPTDIRVLDTHQTVCRAQRLFGVSHRVVNRP